MKHLDLFSGIGGFAYAADQVFGNVEHIFCDNEPFARAVLHKHWPGSEIYDDIRQITTNPFSHQRPARSTKNTQEGQPEEYRRHPRVDLLTGGFPCQPFSAAGLRRGTADERHLWPEMLRVIRLTNPTWVVAENVGGIITWNEGMVFEQVCADLENAGYEVQPFIIPAVAVNAPHRRDRVWFVAHRPSNRRQWRGSEAPAQEGHPTRPKSSRQLPSRPEGQDSWNQDWAEVAAELCSVDDGLSVELDGFKLSKPQHRAAQLKAYGNAIVPQVAMQIMEAIKSF